MASPKSEKSVNNGNENGHGVGALLRASRLRVGEDLHDVAAMLCIRYPYLEAIESARYAELPGLTYAIGFIRAYAAHLGLDSEEVVRRYKAEAATGNAKDDLKFPEPVPESGIPGGAVVFVGIIVAALAYGGWYISTVEKGFLAELVSPLPSRLNELLPEEKRNGEQQSAEAMTSATAETPAPAEHAEQKTAELVAEQAVVAEPENAPTPADGEPGESAATEAAPTQPVAEQSAAADESDLAAQPGALENAPEVVPQTETGVETAIAEPTITPDPELQAQPEPPAMTGETVEVSAPTDTTTAATEPVTAAETAALVSPSTAEETASPAVPEAQRLAPVAAPISDETATVAAEGPQTATVEAVGPDASLAAAPETVPDSETQAQSEQAALPSEPVSAASPEPERVILQTESAPVASRPRIVVRARLNSWIQVRDDIGNQLLVTRLLRTGDHYEVPDQPGLRLLTGNAGALEILVDGELVPAIGDEGAVRRNVMLDAEKLRAGTAVNN